MLSVGKWKKNKLGVSVIIGYILLVAFAVVTGAIVYNYLRTYVPTQPLSCPDGVSLFVQDSNYCGNQLNLTIRNNGRFDVAGYYIRATNSSSQTIPIIDLSSSLNSTYGGFPNGNLIMFSPANNNSFTAGNQTMHVYTISSSLGNISSIQIVPAVYEVQNNRNILARCSNAIQTESDIQCTVGCIPAINDNLNAICGIRVCGTQQNGTCGSISCGTCTGGNVCNSTGQCVSQSQCIDTCTNLGFQCGTHTVCGVNTLCGTCSGTNNLCNSTGQCVSSLCGTPDQVCSSGGSQSCTINGYPGTQTCNSQCTAWSACTTTYGNGVCDPGETCAEPACQGYQAACTSGNVCISGSCQPIGGGSTCTNYCISLVNHNPRYTSGSCLSSSDQCQTNGGTYESGGNPYCPLGSSLSPTGTCCCF
ncbi:MAG: hypothetical protein ABSG05_00965 [Candidatus Pacearchaeota archaeon]|jgi:hypothetical protein